MRRAGIFTSLISRYHEQVSLSRISIPPFPKYLDGSSRLLESSNLQLLAWCDSDQQQQSEAMRGKTRDTTTAAVNRALYLPRHGPNVDCRGQGHCLLMCWLA